MRRISRLASLLSVFSVLTSCAANTGDQSEKYSIALMTDTGGINDQAFNQSAWEGAKRVKQDLDFNVRYIESKQVSDYKTNLDSLADSDPDMIFVMGYTAADVLKDVAGVNTDQHYTIIDNEYDEKIDNILSVRFRDEEPAFLVGYIAGSVTKSNKIGFIGGAKSDTIDAFEFGFRAGVAWAAKELDKEIDVEVQYADNFQDDTKGKAMANVMYSKGIDIIYHGAGNLGRGVIEAAKENNKYVIGADRDQKYLAPKNVISSTIKLTGEVVYRVCSEIKETGNLDDITGRNAKMGFKEGVVDISEATKEMIEPELVEKVEDLKEKIINQEIVPPNNESSFDKYISNL
ncbi:MAG: BMP family ABC transporter substrate-binding protein [Oscillospiraceae bacterium]|nr:BMP family ABC transporter substrate-binding protein [Oscillospiraceae bacterium]